MKYLSLCLFLIFLSLQISAQSHVGFRIGYNNASGSFSEAISTPGFPQSNLPTSINGIVGGALIQIELSDQLKLQSELQFTMKGFRLGEGSRSRISLNELAVPIILVYDLSKISIGLGHEIGHIFNGSELDSKVDLSFLGSIGFNINSSLGVDLRYIYGYNGIFRINFTDFNGNPLGADSIMPRTIQLGISYKLPMAGDKN